MASDVTEACGEGLDGHQIKIIMIRICIDAPLDFRYLPAWFNSAPTAMSLLHRFGLALLAGFLPWLAAAADEPVLNLYSARHYQTDEALYQNFTRATGIRINRIEAGDDQLLERLRSEGANSPADVLLIVDAARLVQAQAAGLRNSG
jgi:hypothetical protein